MRSAEEIYESAMNFANVGDKASAIVQLGQAILMKRDYAQAFNNRGNLLLQVGNVFDALLNYDRAIAIQDAPEYHNNRGAALSDLGQYAEAEAAYKYAVQKKPKFVHAWTNLGNVLMLCDRYEESIEAYKKGVEADFNYVDAHLNLSFASLAVGDYDLGWKEYEWRWKSNQIVPRGLPFKLWTPEDQLNPDDAILLYAEQGMGDALQFCRYAPLVKKKAGCKVYIEVRQPLVRFLKTLRGVDGIVSYGEPIPENVKKVAPLMSCPLLFGTTLETIPSPGQYLYHNETRARLFDEQIAKLPPGTFKVGVCWAGERRLANPGATAIDRRRSTSLQGLAELATVQNLSWVSLQKGPPAEQVNKPPRGMTILDCMPDCDDWFDTAALISHLDLVITTDTAVAHVAAAMGKPTWVLARFDTCWRWLRSREDSPWYSSVRHFRMPTHDDWPSLTHKVTVELRKWVEQKKQLPLAA